MFDELDDPAAYAVPPGARDAVAARAARLRRNRRAAWGAGTTALAVALVAALTVSRQGPVDRQAVEPADSPSATSSEEATPSNTPSPEATTTPSPTPEDTPSPTPARTPDADVTPSRTPSPSPTEYAFPGMSPDGKDGWSTGFTWCDQPAELPSEGGAPFAGLTVAVSLPESAESGGGGVQGTATIRNDGDVGVRFTIPTSGSSAKAVADDGHGHVSGLHGNDAVGHIVVELAPGGEQELRVGLSTSMCGDTPDDAGPLPPGTYSAAVVLPWNDAEVDAAPSPSGESPSPSPSWSPKPSSRQGTWISPWVTVELT